MPVSNHIVRSCPFIAESDVLALSKGFAVDGTKLCDEPIGARHTLQDGGMRIVQLLARGTRLAEIYATASRFRIPQRDVHELLGLLNLLGALQRIRHPTQQLPAWTTQVRHLAIGIRYAPVTWRSTCSYRALMTALMRATAPVVAASLFVGVFIGASGLFPTWQAIGLASLGLGMFIASLFAHEQAHIHHIRKVHATPVLLQRGMRLGIIHPSLPTDAEVRTALVGPAWGIGACLLVAGTCVVIHLPVAATTCGIVGIFHLSSLLPWYGDGASLKKALKG